MVYKELNMYNPYDLIRLIVNGNETYGRPVLFDSDPVDMNTLLNKDGDIIRPMRITSICPNCGQGLEIDIKVYDPPFVVETDCYLCRIDPKPVKHRPHREPDGQVDPLLCTTTHELLAMFSPSGLVEQVDPASMVSDRIIFEDIIPEAQVATDHKDCYDTQSSTRTKKKAKKKPKKAKRKTGGGKDNLLQALETSFEPVGQRPHTLEKAVGINEEIDLDDADMIELE